MSKFYVQCGLLEIVLIAETAEDAALAAIDRTLQNHLWIYDDPGLSERDCRDHLMLEALMHLPSTIRVSQRGFGNDPVDNNQVDDNVEMIGTPETILRWHQLMKGLSRMFAAVGLVPRPISTLSGVYSGVHSSESAQSSQTQPISRRLPR